ncbi:YbaN family protein [Devosia sp. CAU 1758]
MLRPLYFALGWFFVALGIIGVFVPLMPTTTFLILAAWCFARSSQKAEVWLLNHKQFGPPITAWRENGAIARRHKFYSLGGMTLGLCMFVLTAKPPLWVAMLVAVALIGIGVFVITRPEPPDLTDRSPDVRVAADPVGTRAPMGAEKHDE